MIRAFLSSAAAVPVLRVAAVFLAGAAVSRAAMGFCLGYLLFGDGGALGNLALVGGYCGALVAATRCRMEMEFRLAGLSEDFAAAQQKRVVRRVLASDAASLEAIGPAQVTAQLEQLTRALQMLDRGIGGFLALLATLLAVLLMAAVRNPTSALIALGIVKVSAILYWVNRRVLGARAAEMARMTKAYVDGVADLVLGFKELKLNPLRAQFLLREVLRPVSRRLGRARAGYETVSTLNQVFAEIVALLAAGATAAAATVLMPDDRVSGGIIAVAIILLPTFALRALPDFLQVKQYLTGLDETLAALPPEPLPPAAEMADRIEQFHGLALHDVVFRPSGGRFVLGPLSCTIPAGRITFLVGGNGSGKSTLMRLLCGLTAPEAGEILLNGEPSWLPAQRHLFSTVFADVHLFDRLYGMPPDAEAEVNAWLERLGIGAVTRVERGRFTKLDLSTGQRKRVALAVALAERRPVLLLDEWAADQDPESRRFFYRDLLPELRAQGRTIIAVSHDDRYFDVADRVLRLEYGKLRPAPAELAV